MEQEEERTLKNLLAVEIKMIDEYPDWHTENYQIYKNKLKDIETKRCKGAAIRSRVQTLIEGERCTAFFLGLEKKRQNNTVISSLINEKGDRVTDQKGILDIVGKYYKKLFQKQNCSKTQSALLLGGMEKKISLADREFCERRISLEEVERAIEGLGKGKSLGSDGLPAEFFSHYKHLVAPLLHKLFCTMHINQSTPDAFSQGIITLIYKNKRGKEQIQNYRPISLLNVDYKILSKILANRIKEVVGSIINHSQAYSIPGRDLADTIGTVRDLVSVMNSQAGVLVGIDMEKAFDRVDHGFLWDTLSTFGFGDEIIGWIKLMYQNSTSRVKCNGSLTEEFSLERSVRQDCPMSSVLYSIVVEPLAVLIQSNHKIKGIQTPGGQEIKMAQYADDLNILVADDNSVDCVLECIKNYEDAAGAKINKHKSEIMFCGTQSSDRNKWGFKVVEEEKKILGIYIGKNIEKARDKTWQELI